MASTQWWCTWCKRSINSFGVPNHRAMHRRRKDGPVVFETRTHRITYDYRETKDGGE